MNTFVGAETSRNTDHEGSEYRSSYHHQSSVGSTQTLQRRRTTIRNTIRSVKRKFSQLRSRGKSMNLSGPESRFRSTNTNGENAKGLEYTVMSSFSLLRSSFREVSSSAYQLPSEITRLLSVPSVGNYFAFKFMRMELRTSQVSNEAGESPQKKMQGKMLKDRRASLANVVAYRAGNSTHSLSKLQRISQETRLRLRNFSKSMRAGTRVRRDTKNAELPLSTSTRFDADETTPFTTLQVIGDTLELPSDSWTLGNDSASIRTIWTLDSCANLALLQPSNASVKTHVSEENTFHNSSVEYGNVDFSGTDFAPVNFAAVVFNEPEFPVAAPPRRAASGPALGAGICTDIFSFFRVGGIPLAEIETTEVCDLLSLPLLSIHSPVLPLFENKSHFARRLSARATPNSGCVQDKNKLAADLQPNASPEPSLADIIGEIDKLIFEVSPKKEIEIVVDCTSSEGSKEERDAFLDEYCDNDMFSFLDETEDLAEQCRRELFDANMWQKTESLLARIEEDTGFTSLPSPGITRFLDDPRVISSVAQSTRNSEKSPQMTAMDDLEGRLSRLGDKSDSKFDVHQEAELLQKVVNNYRRVFAHLIRNMVLPCGDQIRRLVREILYVRATEGELITEASRISREISSVISKMEDNDENYCAYLQGRLRRSKFALGIMENKFKKTQAEISGLEKGFTFHITSLVNTIIKISAMRERVLEKYNLFYTLNDSNDSFGSRNIHQWTHMEEYKKITMWHQNLDVHDFQSLLAKNIRVLGAKSETITTMIDMVSERLTGAERAISLRDPTYQFRVTP